LTSPRNNPSSRTTAPNEVLFTVPKIPIKEVPKNDTHKGYGKTADGYVTTAEYSGELEKHGVEAIVYTVTYIGEEIPPPETDTAQESASVPAYIIIAGGVALLALVTGAALFVIRKRRAEYDTSEAYIPAGREESE
jgi:hypothetical protein